MQGRVRMPRRRSAGVVKLRPEPVWDWINRNNVSQNDLADMLGISHGHFSRLMNGWRGTSPPIRRRLMEILGIEDFDDLFLVEIPDD